MTEIRKFSIITFAIIMIPIIIFAGVYMQDISQNKNNELLQLYAKKDDLLFQQQQIEAMIADLNKTLNNEIGKQQSLLSKQTSLSVQKLNLAAQNSTVLQTSVTKTSTSSSSSRTTTSSSSSTPRQTPAPKPTPTPPPVSRAS